MKKIFWSILTIASTVICQKILPNTLKKKKVVNFDIIHHECRGDPLHRSYKDYQTVNNKDLQKYPTNERKEVVGGLIRNFNRKDLNVEKKIVNEYFKG